MDISLCLISVSQDKVTDVSTYVTSVSDVHLKAHLGSCLLLCSFCCSCSFVYLEGPKVLGVFRKGPKKEPQ